MRTTIFQTGRTRGKDLRKRIEVIKRYNWYKLNGFEGAEQWAENYLTDTSALKNG